MENQEPGKEINRKTTLADLAEGGRASVRKIVADKETKKKLLDLGIVIGSDLTVIKREGDQIRVRDGRCREIQFQMKIAAGIYLKEVLERHLDPVISGGCCTYGNTAGALDRMDRINEETFGK